MVHKSANLKEDSSLTEAEVSPAVDRGSAQERICHFLKRGRLFGEEYLYCEVPLEKAPLLVSGGDSSLTDALGSKITCVYVEKGPGGRETINDLTDSPAAFLDSRFAHEWAAERVSVAFAVLLRSHLRQVGTYEFEFVSPESGRSALVALIRVEN